MDAYIEEWTDRYIRMYNTQRDSQIHVDGWIDAYSTQRNEQINRYMYMYTFMD